MARKYGRKASDLKDKDDKTKAVAEAAKPVIPPGEAPEASEINAQVIELSDIEVDRTWNARSGNWDDLSPDAKDNESESSFLDLVQSVRQKGVEDPVDVRRNPKKGKKPYALVTGFRRVRAAELVGLKTIPAIIHDEMSETQAEERNAIENMARKNLKQADAAFAIARLFRIHGNVTDEFIAQRTGLSNSYVSKLRRIGELPEAITTAWREGRAHVTVTDMVGLANAHKEDPSKTADKFKELITPAGTAGGGATDPHAKLKAEAKALGVKLGMLEYLDVITTDTDTDWDEVISKVIVPQNAKLADPKETSEAGKARSYAKALSGIATAFAEGVTEGKEAMKEREEEEKEETVSK